MKPDIIENKMTIRPSALMTPPLAQFTGYQTCTMCTLRAIIQQAWIRNELTSTGNMLSQLPLAIHSKLTKIGFESISAVMCTPI